MKVLLLGGCGYAGTQVYDVLSYYYDIDSVDLEWYGKTIENNIKEDFSNLTIDFLSKYKVVILLAGHSSVGMCKDRVYDSMSNNVYNFCSLINKLDKIGGIKFIYASSSSIASGYFNGNFKAHNGYDLSKHTIEGYARMFNNIKHYGLRFGTINGYSRNFRKELMINAMVVSSIKNGFINLYAKDTLRPILALSDLVKSIENIIEGNYDSGVYNLASFNMSAEEIGNTVADIMKVPVIDKGGEISPYSFTIKSDFDCRTTIYEIVKQLTDSYTKMNFTDRLQPKDYELSSPQSLSLL